MKEENILWIFLHLPKTGGTTFSRHIKKELKKEAIDISSLLYSKKFKHISNSNNVKVLLGHNTFYGIHNFFPEKKARYITFIRDPSERIISLYNYEMSIRNTIIPFSKWYKTIPKNEMTIFYSRKYNGKVNTRFNIPPNLLPLINSMLRYNIIYFNIKKLISNIISNKKENKMSDNAKKMLDECWFIGDTKFLNDDLKLIFKLMGISTKWKNYLVSKKKGKIKKIIKVNEKLKKKIYNDNKLDYKLYIYASKLRKEMIKRLKKV